MTDRPAPRRAPTRDAGDDQDLVRRILEGSTEAWHLFVLRYDRLILSVLRRYLHVDDEVYGLRAEILVTLRDQKLRTYEGRSRLSTWITLVTRNAALDRLRSQRGRHEEPASVGRLAAPCRRVFRLYFEEGLDLGMTTERMSEEFPGASMEDVVAWVQEIHEKVDPRVFRTLEWRREARSRGISSYRLLQFLGHHREERRDLRLDSDPEKDLIRREAEAFARRVAALVESLPEEERRILDLRYRERLTAREISQRLGMPGARSVYSRIEAAVRNLRRQLERDGMESPPPPGTPMISPGRVPGDEG